MAKGKAQTEKMPAAVKAMFGGKSAGKTPAKGMPMKDKDMGMMGPSEKDKHMMPEHAKAGGGHAKNNNRKGKGK